MCVMSNTVTQYIHVAINLEILKTATLKQCHSYISHQTDQLVVNPNKIPRKPFLVIFWSIRSGKQLTKSRQQSGYREWSNYDVKKMATNGK